jgi:hypothetical protein
VNVRYPRTGQTFEFGLEVFSRQEILVTNWSTFAAPSVVPKLPRFCISQ